MTMIPKNIVPFTHLVIATVGPYIYIHILINTQTDIYIYICIILNSNAVNPPLDFFNLNIF